MPHIYIRPPSSLPNLNDARSDYSTGSRATVSTTAARNYYPQVSHNNNNSNYGPYHHPYDLNGVSANFIMDLKNDQSFQVIPTDGYGYSGRVRHNRRNAKEEKITRQQIAFKHTPSMLLPEKENRRRRTSRVENESDDVEGSFLSYISTLRHNSVVPHDPDKLPIIIAPMTQTSKDQIEDLLSQRSNSSLSTDSGDGSKVQDTVTSTLNESMIVENGGEYIDTFSDNNDIAKFRWALLRSKLKSKRMRKRSLVDQQLSVTDEEESMVSDSVTECPICAKAAQNLGGEEALIRWMLDKLNPVSTKLNAIELSPFIHGDLFYNVQHINTH